MPSLAAYQAIAQTNQWAWMGGSNTTSPGGGNSGVYGTLGTPAAANIPGSRIGGSSWTDASGHLWLFGGDGIDINRTLGDLNDLWQFNPSTNQWTWMGGSNTISHPGVYGTQGTPAAGNIPGSRNNATTWTDSSGHLWLFGGFGSAGAAAGRLNDFWEFDPSTDQWTWMGGSISAGSRPGVYGTLGTPAVGNFPGGRSLATAWTGSSGNLWLFGGYGYDSNGTQGLLNDLWEFSTSTNQWTWMGGSSSAGSHAGVYGTLGTPTTGNTPGSRDIAMCWTDNSGNLWLFGGDGYDANGNAGDLNDLWEFNTVTNQWTWMGGNNAENQSGVYGTLGTPATGNIPGSRYGAVTWTDTNGNRWLSGGAGYGASGTGNLNDLWVLSPSTNQWAWMGGSSTANQSGVYGTLETPSGGNIPGARQPAANWIDSGGHFWLFGGLGYDISGTLGYLNDLWEYQPQAALPTATPNVTVTPSLTSVASTQALTVTVAVGEFGSVTPTGSVVLSGGGYTSASTALVGGTATFNFAAGSLAGGSYAFTASYTPDSAGSATYTGATGASATVTVAESTAATPVFSAPAGTYSSAQTVTITDATAGATIYYTTNGTTPTASSTVYTGVAITISSSETLEAIAELSGHTNSAVAFAGYLISPSAVGGALDWTWMAGSNTVNHVGVYGTLATPAAGNIPGSRDQASSWTDSSGHFWLFGGVGYGASGSGYLNDLWEFNPSTSQWAWINGSSAVGQASAYGTLGTPAAANVPGGRINALSWTDNTGHLWLFGGTVAVSGDLGFLDDLWEFNPSTSQWAWMGGSNATPPCSNNACGLPGVYGTLGTPAAGNIPGGRELSVSWTDSSGNLWLFGGFGHAATGPSGDLNDLWEFNPSTNQWTWMGGSSTSGDQFGVYGTLGVPAAANIPGSRELATSWTDSSGNLWLFGGFGFGATTEGYLNDLWEFNPTTSQWAWMGGSKGGQSSVYGTVGIPAPGNTPGGRAHPSTWTDSGGHVWLFGGDGYAVIGTGYLNDLWVLNPSTNLWAWMGGNNADNQSGVYGTLGTPAGTNIPGGRYEGLGWTDSSGHLWLFGGDGYANSTFGILNDLWEYQPPSQLPLVAPTVAVTPSSTSITTLQALTLTVGVAEGVGSVIPTGTLVLTGGGYTSPSAALVGGSATFNLAAGALPVGSYTFTASYTPDSSSSATYNSATGTSATVKVALPVTATPVFSAAAGSYTSAQTVTITDATPGAIIYYTTNGTTPTTSSTAYSGGTITVSSSETLEAIATFSGYTNSAVASAGYLISPLAIGGALDWTWMGGSNTVAQTGVYGTLGTPAPANTPGSRFSATSSIDASGNLWLFGGEGYTSSNTYTFFNDLWEFNPSTSQWAWMGGSSAAQPCSSACGLPGVYGTLGTPASANIPGNRAFATGWTDSSGHFWLFGGYGYDAGNTGGELNDLWMFNPATNQWAWMSGSSTIGSTGGRSGVYGSLGTPGTGNVPGSRGSSVSWADSSGRLWLFGGTGFDASGNSGYLNDLWEFNPTTSQWAWMGGSSTVGSANGRPGVYGTLGAPASGNNPGSRVSPATWTDGSGNLWLFGGYGSDVNGTLGDLNDLWEFNPSTGQWTWMGGSSTTAHAGVYGTLGTPAPGNIPGSRGLATSWADTSGNLWLFGGGGYDANDALASLSDLWVFNPSANQWAWMGGSSIGSHAGVYGTLGTPAAGNIPGGRNSAVGWTGSSGHLWLFGGNGFDLNGRGGYLNDLWEFQLPSSQVFTSQTISFTAPASPVTYGVSPIALAATGGASGNPMVFSIVSGPGTVSGNMLTITGAGTVAVAANQAGNSSYWGAAQVTQSIVVNPATLTVGVLGTPTLIFGQPTPPLPYTIGPFVNGDTQASATTGAPTLTTTAVPRSAIGTYPITVGQGTLAAANYIFTTMNGSLNVIGGAAQSILFPALANFAHGTSVSLIAIATSGLPVTFTVASGPASISGSTLTITGTGPVSVTASQPGNANFAAAAPVTQSFIAQ